MDAISQRCLSTTNAVFFDRFSLQFVLSPFFLSLISVLVDTKIPGSLTEESVRPKIHEILGSNLVKTRYIC